MSEATTDNPALDAQRRQWGRIVEQVVELTLVSANESVVERAGIASANLTLLNMAKREGGPDLASAVDNAKRVLFKVGLDLGDELIEHYVSGDA